MSAIATPTHELLAVKPFCLEYLRLIFATEAFWPIIASPKERRLESDDIVLCFKGQKISGEYVGQISMMQLLTHREHSFCSLLDKRP